MDFNDCFIMLTFVFMEVLYMNYIKHYQDFFLHFKADVVVLHALFRRMFSQNYTTWMWYHIYGKKRQWVVLIKIIIVLIIIIIIIILLII